MVGGYVGAKIGFSAGILKQTLIEAALPMDRIINSISEIGSTAKGTV